ncbi:apiosidase-like domain-containing protein [Microbacterium jiangjiandongii]|uniref:apiosidase-like domain-containing protein n=1 Tax=Microbacterium jiangjiandongii TaxID=3049071 RepID=UPI00214BF309|nr:DUF4038 domain-containing protein [Microbacterium sp. zg.Y843]MCR2816691.1 DUF4038 domain-containing protein [Microbacterium sp. zg.Y843]
MSHPDGDGQGRSAQGERADVGRARESAPPTRTPRTFDRRSMLRYGLIGAGGVAVAALGGFAIARSQEPGVAPTTPRPTPSGGATSAGTAFPVGVSDTGRGFVDAQGRTFVYLADTAWTAPSRMTREEFERLATARRDTGYTALQMSVLDFSPQADNALGHAPFTATGRLDSPLTSADGDDYWGHIDWCLQTCRDLGLVACLVPSWYGGWGDAWRGHLTERRAGSYGSFLADRYGHLDHVWWLLGGDNEPDATDQSTAGVPSGLEEGPVIEETIAMGRALREGASVPQLMSYHTARGLTAEEYFGDEDWYTISAAYSGAYPAVEVAAEYARDTVRPVVLWEAYYAQRDEEPLLDRRAVRAQAYHALFAGAAGFAYGHSTVWPVGDGWERALTHDSARDIGTLASLLHRHADAELTPVTADSPAAGLLPDGYGTVESTSAVSAATLPEGRGALAYFGEPRRTVRVDTTAVHPTAAFEIRWADPATGEELFVSSGTTGADVTVGWPPTWIDGVLILRR